MVSRGRAFYNLKTITEKTLHVSQATVPLKAKNQRARPLMVIRVVRFMWQKTVLKQPGPKAQKQHTTLTCAPRSLYRNFNAVSCSSMLLGLSVCCFCTICLPVLITVSTSSFTSLRVLQSFQSQNELHICYLLTSQGLSVSVSK